MAQGGGAAGCFGGGCMAGRKVMEGVLAAHGALLEVQRLACKVL